MHMLNLYPILQPWGQFKPAFTHSYLRACNLELLSYSPSELADLQATFLMGGEI